MLVVCLPASTIVLQHYTGMPSPPGSWYYYEDEAVKERQKKEKKLTALLSFFVLLLISDITTRYIRFVGLLEI